MKIPLGEGFDLLRSNLLQIDIQGFMVACVGASFLVRWPREIKEAWKILKSWGGLGVGEGISGEKSEKLKM